MKGIDFNPTRRTMLKPEVVSGQKEKERGEGGCKNVIPFQQLLQAVSFCVMRKETKKEEDDERGERLS